MGQSNKINQCVGPSEGRPCPKGAMTSGMRCRACHREHRSLTAVSSVRRLCVGPGQDACPRGSVVRHPAERCLSCSTEYQRFQGMAHLATPGAAATVGRREQLRAEARCRAFRHRRRDLIAKRVSALARGQQ